ncbi:MAG: hypothetical protein PHH94_09210, partial [Sphaerochaetaceae bacterium]|nr:hypothetical protein [Sphaerochaetaceae bacterium]
LYESLSKLDAKINDSVSHGGTEPVIERWEAFQYLTENFIVKPQEEMTPDEHFKDVFRQVKVLIAPITPPNFELERAVTSYMKQNGYQIPRGSRYRSAVAQKTRKPRQKTIHKRTPKKKLPESLQS